MVTYRVGNEQNQKFGRYLMNHPVQREPRYSENILRKIRLGNDNGNGFLLYN